MPSSKLPRKTKNRFFQPFRRSFFKSQPAWMPTTAGDEAFFGDEVMVVVDPSVFCFLDSLKNEIQSGKISFESAVTIHSDDFKNKTNGGLLPSFGIGSRYEQRFEEAAFRLNKIGEVSGPIETQSGFHLLQLVNKQTLDSTEALNLLIEDKIKADYL